MSPHAQYLIKGPLDPAVYDGDTPLLVVLDQPLQVYRVELEYEIRQRRVTTVEIAAPHEALAMLLAWKQSERDAEPGECNHMVRQADALDREPTEAEVMAWVKAKAKGARS